MIATLQISADSGEHARQAAIGQWRAQGWTSVEAVMVSPAGDRLFTVQATVSRR